MKQKNITIKKGANKAGKQYAIVQLKNTDKYVVYGRKENYNRGKIITSWGYVTPKNMDFQAGQKYAKEGIPYDEALALYNKKLKGKIKH